MVWIIEGQLNSNRNLEEAAAVPPSSHYLRPARFYKAGRMQLVKDGVVVCHDKPYDFRIKSTNVSKDGAWAIQTGIWTTNDVASDREVAYSIEIIPIKAVTITRDGNKIELGAAPTTPFVLISGDSVAYKNRTFTVRWEPVIVFVPKGVKKVEKAEFERQALDAGISLSFNPEHTHHTILLLKEFFEPSSTTLTAALSNKSISSLDWLRKFFASTTIPTATAETLVKEGAESDAAFLARKEKVSLDQGADPKYSRHSILELDWTALPSPTEYLVIDPQYAGSYEAKNWAEPKVGRSTLFKDVSFISFRNIETEDRDDKKLVELTGGSYFAVPQDLENNEIQPKIREFLKPYSKAANHRIAFIKKTGDEPLSLHKAIAKSVEVTHFCEGPDLVQAIYDANLRIIFPPEPPSKRIAQPPSSNGFLVAPTPSASQGPSGMQPSSFASIAGTHPEESSLRPGQGGRVAAAEARKSLDGILPPIETSGMDSTMEPPRRKLTRRVKTHVVEPIPEASTALYSEYGTHQSQGPAPDLNVNSASSSLPTYSMDLDNSTAVPTRRPLKRRIGAAATEPKTNVYESDDDDVPPKRPRVIEEEEEIPVASGSGQRIREDSVVDEIPSAQQKRSITEVGDSSGEEATVEKVTKKKARVESPVVKKKVPVKATAVKSSPKSAVKTKGRTKAKVVPKKVTEKIVWDGYDSVDELERLIREDQNDMNEVAKGEFIIKMFDITERIRNLPRLDLDLPEKWAGRPNFKGFKPKGMKRAGVVAADRPPMEFFLSNVPDFGMGEAYKEKKKPAKSVAKKGSLAQQDSDDDSTQLKLNFVASGQAKKKSAPTPTPTATSSKGKGKKKAVISETDEAEEFASDTLDQNAMDVDEDDSEEDQLATQKSKSKAKAPVKKPAVKKPPVKKAPVKKVVEPKAKAKPVAKASKVEMIVIDSDSSDDGIRFKGFGKTQKKK